MALNFGGYLSARVNFERDERLNTCRKCRTAFTFLLYFGRAQMISGPGVKRIELVLRQRPRAQTKLNRDIV